MGVGSVIGRAGHALIALGVLALAAPAVLEAQVGLASGASRIALIARVLPRASINGMRSARETARRGNVREETITVPLSANTGYRLMVVGTAPVSSDAGIAATLWVRDESGHFEEVKPGAAVTVIRGRYAVAGWEPEVTFRSQFSESLEGAPVIPVRYEVRIDPTI